MHCGRGGLTKCRELFVHTAGVRKPQNDLAGNSASNTHLTTSEMANAGAHRVGERRVTVATGLLDR